MIRLLRFLLGYVRFEYLYGFREDFINECFRLGLDIKGVEPTEHGFTAMCSVKTYKKLHTHALRSGGKIHITAKKGLPFLLHPINNRFGFLSGIVAFILIISLLSGFVWSIDYKGCSVVSEVTLATYLEQNGFKVGTMWSAIDKDKLCCDIMRDFDEVSWVHINQRGTTAVVEINEARPVPEPDENKLKGHTVFRRQLEVVAYRQQSNLRVSDTKNYFRLHFYLLDLPLYIEKKAGDFEEVCTKALCINGVTLPVSYTKYTEKSLSSSPADLSDDELYALALNKLEHEEFNQLDGYTIVNRSITKSLDRDKCVLTAAYIIRENNK